MRARQESTNARGFTLLETLLIVFLLALVFGGATVMLSQSFQVIRFMEGHGKLLASSATGLDRIVCEAREAILISSPPTLTSAPGVNDIFFIKLDPSQQPTRLPDPIPYPVPASYAPFASAQELSVHFSVNPATQTLLREVGTGGGPTTKFALCSGVTELHSYWRSGCLVVELKVIINNVPITISQQVQCVVAR